MTPSSRKPLSAARGGPTAASASRPSGWPDVGRVLAVAAGGTIGAALRYVFTVIFPTDPGRFPLTTFAENVIGAFLLGLSLALILERTRPMRRLHPFLCTGVLGSFTTFSNFSLELVLLGESGHVPLAVIYAMTSIFAGLLAALLGVALARTWPPRIGRKEST